jgi:anti-sigma factor RsiW
MHSVVMENLEEFLAGTLEPAERQAVEAHLSGCGQCREEVHGMQGVSLLFSSFRASSLQPHEAFEAPLGFYARVMQRAEESRPTASFASLFALDAVFGRKLVLSCLLTLGVLSGYLISRESSYMAGPTPEAIMAEQTRPAFDSAPATASMLVTLTNYEH